MYCDKRYYTERIATKNLYRRCHLPPNHSDWGTSSHLQTMRCPSLQARIHLRGVVLNVQSALQRRRCIISGHDYFHQLEASIVPEFSAVEKFTELLLVGHLVRFRRRRLFNVIENAQQISVVPGHDVVVLSVRIGMSKTKVEEMKDLLD